MKHLILENANFIYWQKEFSEMIQTIGYGNGRETMYPSNVNEFLYFLEQKEISILQDISHKHILEYYQYLCNRPNDRFKVSTR